MGKFFLLSLVLFSFNAYSIEPFSAVVPRTSPVRFATGAQDTRSIGCTNGSDLMYVDLNGSKLAQGQFEPIVSKFSKVGRSDSKAISSYLVGSTDQTAGQVTGLTLKYVAWGTSSTSTGTSAVLFENLSMQYRFIGNVAELTVDNRSDRYGSTFGVPGGAFSCELFAEPYYQEVISQRVYDCSNNISFYLKRNYGAENVVRIGSGSAKILRLQNAYVNDYAWLYVEESDSTASSQRTHFKTPVGGTTWNQVLTASTPVASFTVNNGTCNLRR